MPRHMDGLASAKALETTHNQVRGIRTKCDLSGCWLDWNKYTRRLAIRDDNLSDMSAATNECQGELDAVEAECCNRLERPSSEIYKTLMNIKDIMKYSLIITLIILI